MRLFTIQEEYKYFQFQKTGILKADDNIICHESFVDSYTWMESKMYKLLPVPKIEVIHPVWAWYKCCGKNKPDLRRKYIEKGKIGYRIEFEMDEKKVLLTDFSDWHLILNASDEDRRLEYSSLSIIDDDLNQDDIEYLLNNGSELIDNKLIFNWDKIILDKNSYKQDIQATMWYIDMSQVINVDKFKSR